MGDLAVWPTSYLAEDPVQGYLLVCLFPEY